jgi:hypothetical protein
LKLDHNFSSNPLTWVKIKATHYIDKWYGRSQHYSRPSVVSGSYVWSHILKNAIFCMTNMNYNCLKKRIEWSTDLDNLKASSLSLNTYRIKLIICMYRMYVS